MDITDYFNWRGALQTAKAHAEFARFDAFLASCRKVVDLRKDDVEALLAVASLLSSFGYVCAAKEICQHVLTLDAGNRGAVALLADLARDRGDHDESRRLFAELLRRLPDDPAVRRNSLMSMEYDPAVADIDRLRHARDWGAWAMRHAGGARPRPPARAAAGRTSLAGGLCVC